MPKDQAWRWYVAALAVVDAALLGLAFVLAALLRAAIDVLPFQPSFEADRYGLVAAAVIPGLLVIFWLRGAYARHNLMSGPEEYARVVSGCTYGIVLVVAASYLYGSTPLVSRSWLLLFWLLAIALVGLGRFSLRRLAHGLRRHGWFVRRALVAGASDQGLAIAQQVHGPIENGIEVVGFLDDYLPVGTRPSAWGNGRTPPGAGLAAVVGHPREAQALVEELNADLLIVLPAALSWESQQALVQLGMMAWRGLEVRVAPTQYDIAATGIDRRSPGSAGAPARDRRRARPQDYVWSARPAPLGYLPLFQLQPARVVGMEAVLRRIVDASLAALLLAFAAPALAWLVIVARGRGIQPLLVERRVLGRGGQPMTLRLLNPRISQRLLLRGLPALLAVLRGQLALVGPRPVPVEEQAQAQRWASFLLAVKPGLTGPWRLASPAASLEERMLADVWWVRNWSIWRHLFVLFQTARALWGGGRTRRRPRILRWESQPTPAAVSPALAGRPRGGRR